MNPENQPSEVFPPLPVRSRGVLEMLDASIKLYKQYFLILIGWSSAATVLIGLCQLVGLVIPGIAFVVSALAGVIPLGATVCCIAAAVRGQRVTFKQCWQFTKPRYWPLVGISILAKLILAFAVLCLGVLGAIAGAGGYYAVSGASDSAQLAAAVIGVPILVAVISVPLVIAFIWQGMVCIVICMEDNNRNANSLGRAYDLMRQNWMRVISLMTMFSLLLFMLFGFMAFCLYVGNALPQFKDILDGNTPSSSFVKEMSVLGVAFVAISIIWEPWNYLILSLLYLDLRVRKEALDLEWSAHVTAPQIDPATVPAYNFGSAANLGRQGQVAAFTGTETHTWAPNPHPNPAAVPQGYAPPQDYPVTQPPQGYATPAPVDTAASTSAPSTQHSALDVGIVKCPLCGTENSLAGEFCAACGARVRPTT